METVDSANWNLPIQDPHQLICRNRSITGMSAVLLPFQPSGEIDWKSYAKLIEQTVACGLIPAVNMDTGYAHLISDQQRQTALEITNEVVSGKKFIAGAFISDQPEATFNREAYCLQIDLIHRFDGTPIIFQSFGLAHSSDENILSNYASLANHCSQFYAFELGQMFAPFGNIYSPSLFQQIIGINECVGIKHSSLNRQLEWQRIAIRNQLRPDFKILTGNDLAIDMIMYGSDYLLGLSAFAPEAFSERDRRWRDGDSSFFQLNDILQYLGFFAFRNPVPAYKHSAAMYLHLTGRIGSDLTHPSSPNRPENDIDVLREISQMIQAEMTKAQL